MITTRYKWFSDYNSFGCKNWCEVENKIPNTSNLVTTIVLNTKTNEVGNKIPENSKYITIQEFH